MSITRQAALIRGLIKDLAENSACEKINAKRKGVMTDVSLVNQYARHDFIPNKWFDWERRAGAQIMIIGQDWGPYVALKKYVDDYEIDSKLSDFDYEDFLLKAFSSRTEKFIMRAIKETYQTRFNTFAPDVYEKFFFTVAVMFTRQGKHFRGSGNFDEKTSFEISYPYLARQIEIVKPKAIMPLGGLAFRALDRYYKLGMGQKSITSIISGLDKDLYIKVGDTKIIPNFHPASYTDPKIQLKRWAAIWDFL